MKEKFSLLKMIHLALCSGVIVVYLFIGKLYTLDFLNLPRIDTTALIYLFVPLLAIVFSHFMYQFQLKQIKEGTSEADQFFAYQTAMIIRWAILEGGSFIQPSLLIFGFISIFYLIVSSPSEQKMKRDIEALGK